MHVRAGAATAFVLSLGFVSGALIVAARPGPVCQLNRIGDACDPPTAYGALLIEWAYMSIPGMGLALLLLLAFWTAQRRRNG